MYDDVTIIGIADVRRKLGYIRHDLANKKMMAEIGLFLTAKIETRTASGKDVDGDAFNDYSPAYRLIREKSGRSGSKVNLFWSGSLMSSLTFEETNDTVRLFFQSTSDAEGMENPAKAFFLNEDRRFFGISEEDRQGVLKIIRAYLRRSIGRR